MVKTLPEQLNFINKFRVSHRSLEEATWRTNAFSDNIWHCLFGTTSRTIDFHKILNDGSLLTAPNHHQLLVSLKRFLCLQTHPLLTGAVVVNSTTAARRVMWALHIIDYFLLRSGQFRIAEYGFGQVSANDVVGLIDVLTENRRPKESIYEPKRCLLEHLESVRITPQDLKQVRKSSPGLCELEPGLDLVFSPEQTIAARVWLKLNDYYVDGRDQHVTEYKYRVSRTQLLNSIIGQKVLAPLRFMQIALPGLDVAPSQSFRKELSAVPVSNLDDDDRASEELIMDYVSVLNSMRLARQHGIEMLSESALAGIDMATVLLKERTKARARFTTLPFDLANNLLGKSLAFYLDFGEPLVDLYLSLAREGKHPSSLCEPISEKLRQLGISTWQIETDKADEFFAELRRGSSLFNMLEVLWGSIAIIVNTLMARRLSELEDLTAASIVRQGNAFFLATNQRKRNVLDHRERILRPLPTIAAEALNLLAKVSRTLQELGLPNDGKLFEMPYSAWNKRGPNYGTCLPDLARCFDRFCDYHQTDVDEFGRRYYVRAHQLRRNFAMLFFWKGSFGGIEVLRYFLGHSSPAMTYRYITEALSGKVLRRVKANVAKDLVRRDHAATEELSHLICERYGLTLNDLHILPERDVADYIEDLMISGEAEIEPEFFNGPKGEEYRIVYKIKRR